MHSLSQAIQQYFKFVEGPVRVSYANLITHARQASSPPRTRVPIAVLNKRSLQKGERKWQALGGAAHLTLEGVQDLEERFGASDFEIDEKSGTADARFVVAGSFLQEVAYWLVSANSDLLERDPSREFYTEIGAPGSDLGFVTFASLGVAVQPPNKEELDTSARSKGKPPTRRLFSCFEAACSTSGYQKLVSLPHVRRFSNTILARTKGGTQGAMLNDGSVIANNLGVPISYLW